MSGSKFSYPPGGGSGSSPLTTKGDIYTYSTVDTRLPVGTNGQVLSSNSATTTGLEWIAAGGTGTVTSVASGNGMNFTTITTTGSVTMGTPSSLSVSSTNALTTNSHTHAITSSSAPGAAASILSTDSSGIIGSTGTRIVKGWFTDLTVTNAITGSITGNAGTATALATPRTIGTITGDATSAGSSFDGSANNSNAITLATVNANVGSFTNANITVNAKGLITAASNGTAGSGTVSSGTTGKLAYYAANGTTVSPTTDISISSSVLTLGVSSGVSQGQLVMAGNSSGTTALIPSAAATGTLTLPSATDTLVARATTDTLSNKTIAAGSNTITGLGVTNLGGITGTPTSSNFLRGDGTWSTPAGSGDMLLAGVQTVTGAKTFNNNTLILAGSTSGTLTLQSQAIAGTNTVVFPLTGTLSTLAGTETLTNKTLTTPRIGQINDGSGNGIVTFTNPSAGNAQITGVGARSLLLAAGATGSVQILDSNDNTKVINFDPSGGTTSTFTSLKTSQTTNRVLTFPDATDTLVGKATTDTFTNKTYDTAGTGNSFSINGVAVTTNTGTGAVVRALSPTLVTPTLGAATATSINGLTITSSTGTLTVVNGGTLVTAGAFSQTHTVTATTNVTYPSGTSTLYGTGTGTITSSQLATSLSDETGTGAAVFGTSPTITTPIINQFGTASGIGAAWTTWSPTLTNLTGGTLNYAKYLQIGKIVYCRFKYTLAGAGVGGAVSFTLPVTASSDYTTAGETFGGTVSLIDAGVNFYAGVAMWNSSTTVAVRFQTGTTINATSSTTPFTWGTGDFIQCHFFYEAV